MQQTLSEFMRKELIFYIKHEYEKGIPINNIKDSLLNGGHHDDLVKEAMKSLKKHKFNVVKALNEPMKQNLDRELYMNIVNSLVRYIEHQIAQGKSISEIKKILTKYGHSEDIIKKAISSVKRKEEKTQIDLPKVLDISIVLGLFLMIFIVSGMSKEPLQIVFAGFLPSVLTVIAVNLESYHKDYRKYIWYTPVVLPMIFATAGMLNQMLFSGMEVFKLSVLNLAISIVYTAVKSATLKEQKDAMAELEKETMSFSDVEADDKNDSEKTNKSKNKSKDSKSKKND